MTIRPLLLTVILSFGTAARGADPKPRSSRCPIAFVKSLASQSQDLEAPRPRSSAQLVTSQTLNKIFTQHLETLYGASLRQSPAQLHQILKFLARKAVIHGPVSNVVPAAAHLKRSVRRMALARGIAIVDPISESAPGRLINQFVFGKSFSLKPQAQRHRRVKISPSKEYRIETKGMDGLTNNQKSQLSEALKNSAYNVAKSVHVDLDSKFYAENALFSLPQPFIKDANGFDFLYTPIGQYGEELSQTMIRTTQVLFLLINQQLPEILKHQTSDESSAILQNTARGLENSHARAASLQIMYEGVFSLHQLILLLTSQQIEGYEDGFKLVEHLLETRENGRSLVAEIVPLLPMGLVGPNALAGTVPTQTLETREEGKLHVSTEFKTWLAAERRRYRAGLSRTKNSSTSASHLNSISRGCPVALCMPGLKESGIQTLGLTFLKIFRMVQEDSSHTP